MKNYYRIMLGRKSVYADECYRGNFIGADFGIDIDLTGKLPDNWKNFNREFIPILQKKQPERSRISAGLACGALWTVSKGIKIGDFVLCPDGSGNYFVGEVLDNYSYHTGEILPHRRTVKWLPRSIEVAEMSLPLQNSIGARGTVSQITKYGDEIERLISGQTSPIIISTDESVEDPVTFALEKHLEEFLIQNWKQTELGKFYDIYEDEGEMVGQQFQTDTGSIDILAISKDKKELLVVELKRGRASDNVVGQVQRYMGYVKEELLETGQTVKGVIIALEDDVRIRRALAVTTNIEFYRYEVTFKLFKNK